MRAKKALKAILFISLAGLVFSGYLSYGELFRGVCPLGGCSSVLGLPACVYGFIMYLAVLTACLIGLKEDDKKI